MMGDYYNYTRNLGEDEQGGLRNSGQSSLLLSIALYEVDVLSPFFPNLLLCGFVLLRVYSISESCHGYSTLVSITPSNLLIIFR